MSNEVNDSGNIIVEDLSQEELDYIFHDLSICKEINETFKTCSYNCYPIKKHIFMAFNAKKYRVRKKYRNLILKWFEKELL